MAAGDTYLVSTYTDVAAVHVFGSKIVIVRENGVVIALPGPIGQPYVEGVGEQDPEP